MKKYGINPKDHVIAANKRNCVVLAAGYYLATRKVPIVYMQNSGEGNFVNPVCSLTNDKVYAIPTIFIALGIAYNKQNTKIWCINGDGAALMHIGAMGIIGATAPKNYVHVLINNGSH